LVLTPLVRLLAVRLGDIDRPSGNKIHLKATPLMGGVAVYAAFLVTCVFVVPIQGPVIGVLVGGLGAVLVGVLDELLTLPPLTHLAGQIAAAVLAVVAGIGFVQHVSVPGPLTAPGLQLPAALGIAFTIFWLVAMMNTVNFLDGLDGLASGVSLITALLMAIWAWEAYQNHRFLLPPTAHPADFVLPLALAGALLGFLPFNWHVARIFLGDSGAMFLGFALAALSIVGPTKLGTALLVLIIPVLDVAWAIVRRQIRGRSFLTGDKQHVYHRMLDLGLSHTQTVLMLYGLCIALGGLDLWLLKLQKLLAFVALAIAAGSLYVVLEIRASRLAVDSAESSGALRKSP
jgi:UDP-GlcNAc:undecaprenyl-phosphate/decaprenyl-phosphate GlcNAc-1-phosphate transferase